MPYTIHQVVNEGEHKWALARAACVLKDTGDPLVCHIVELVRRSYGEHAVLAEAAELMGDDIEAGIFDLVHLKTAIRLGLPDPDKEGKKPAHLTNYRAESAEMVAKAALAVAYGIEYPAAPQQGAPNPNQPILGFDGWGLHARAEGNFVLVLVQVKGTDQNKCPPDEAFVLAEECKRAPRDPSPIARALTVLVQLVSEDDVKRALLWMLEELGRGHLPPIYIAPAIVRGRTECCIEDLSPIQVKSAEYTPAVGRGIAVSIGVGLTEFGRVVMDRARGAA